MSNNKCNPSHRVDKLIMSHNPYIREIIDAFSNVSTDHVVVMKGCSYGITQAVTVHTGHLMTLQAKEISIWNP